MNDKEAVCRFLEDIEHNFKYIKILTHNTQQQIVLKEQHIPIQVTSERRYNHEMETIWNYEESEAESRRVYALKILAEEKSAERITNTQIAWEKAKDKHNKIVILADPGMGKSTLLAMEAIITAKTERERLDNNQKTVDQVIFPLFISLPDLAETNTEIIEAIPTCIKRYYPKTSARIEHFLAQKLNEGKCLLLLDAWDEVPKVQCHKILQNLTRFVTQFVNNSSNRVILTSRIVGYREPVIDGAKEMEIVPFSQWQKEQYIETWFKNTADYLDDDSISPQGLINELRQQPQIDSLVQNPLLLALLCTLYQNENFSLPSHRFQLYEKALKYMLEGKRLLEHRSETEESWIIAKIELLESLAYQFTIEGKEWFWRNDLVDKIDQFIKSNLSGVFRNVNADALIREISENDGIIQSLNRYKEISPNRCKYIFIHQTLQEYLTASYLKQKVKNPEDLITFVQRYSWDFYWHETLILLAGLLEEPSLLLKTIINQKDDIFWTQLLLAGRCLAECQDINKTLATQIINQIYDLWNSHPNLDCLQSLVILLGQSFPIMREKLKTSIQGSNWLDRRREIVVLGKIGDPEIIPGLLSLFHERNFENICIIAELLKEINTLEAIKALIKIFDTSRSNLSLDLLLSALTSTANPCIVPDLIRLLKSSYLKSDFKPFVAEILGDIGDSRAVSALTTALLNNEKNRNKNWYGVKVRVAAAKALGKIGDPSAVPALIQVLNDPYFFVVLNAVEALGKIQDIRAFPALTQVLNYSNSKLKIATLKALANIDLPQIDAVSILINILQDKNLAQTVKYDVINALKDLGKPETVPALIEALLNEVLEVKIIAAEALGNIGNIEAVPILIKTLQHSENVLRYKAAEALGNIGDIEAAPALIMALQDAEKISRGPVATVYKPFSQSVVIGSMIEALGKIGTPEAVPVLTKTLQDSNWKIRYNSAEALGKIGTPEVISPLLKTLKDSHGYVRCIGAIALEKVGNLRVLRKLIQYPDRVIYNKDVFPVIRRLAIKWHKSKVGFIPVYPQKGIRKIIQLFALTLTSIPTFIHRKFFLNGR